MGLLEDLTSLRSDVAAMKKAMGRHVRVPEARWGTVTVCTATEIRVGWPEGGDCVVTRSSEAVWVGAQVMVQIQGRDRWITALGGGVIPAAVSVEYSGVVIPPGWMSETGAAVSRAIYWRLFAALGGVASPWGLGDGSTTFNLPNAVDRVSVASGGTYAIGATGGADTHDHQFAISLFDNGYTATSPNAAMGGAGDAGAWNARTSAHGGASANGTSTQIRQPGGTAASGSVTRYTSNGYTYTASSLPKYLARPRIIKF